MPSLKDLRLEAETETIIRSSMIMILRVFVAILNEDWLVTVASKLMSGVRGLIFLFQRLFARPSTDFNNVRFGFGLPGSFLQANTILGRLVSCPGFPVVPRKTSDVAHSRKPMITRSYFTTKRFFTKWEEGCSILLSNSYRSMMKYALFSWWCLGSTGKYQPCYSQVASELWGFSRALVVTGSTRCCQSGYLVARIGFVEVAAL